ncbi:MAG: serine hydrolase [Chloroflexota bacterium]
MKLRWMSLVACLIGALLVVSISVAQFEDTGVRAEAQATVNYRAFPGTDSETLGQLEVGVSYAVLGQHELFPWVLLGNVADLHPIGWVFEDIVTITGNINSVPFVDTVVSANPATAMPIQSPVATGSNNATDSDSVTLTPTPPFNVAGTTFNQINIRYGPGVDYARVGVAEGGERFQIVGYHTQFPWVQIRYDASPTGTAWIQIDLLTIEGDIFTTTPVTTTVFNLPTLTPTPAVVQSAGGLSAASEEVSPELIGLGNQLFSLALSRGFDPETNQFGSLYLQDLETSQAIGYGADIAYSGTSVNKVVILVALYAVLNAPPREQLATDIANTMICSENASTNRVLEAVGNGDAWAGARQATSLLEALGIENTFLLSPYVVDPANPPIPPAPIPAPVTEANQSIAFPDPYNQATVQDLGGLMGAIYQCGYEDGGPLIDTFGANIFEPRECRQMLHVMSSNTVDGLLRAGVPETTRVAHKHGWINDTHMNAGVFFTEGGNYAVSMALHSNRVDVTGSRYVAFPDTLPVFATTSLQIYNFYNPDSTLEVPREGFIPEAPTCQFAGSPLIADLMQSTWDE